MAKSMPMETRQRIFTIFPHGAIRPAGWIEEYLRREAAGITGNLDRLCQECSSGIFFENKVGDEQNGVWSSWWNGESEGSWAEAFVRLSILLGDSALFSRSEDYLAKLLKSQERDGYMGIYKPDYRFQVTGKRSGEYWTQSKILMTLLTGYRAGSRQDYLQAVDRLATTILEAHRRRQPPASVFAVPDEDGSKTHGLMIIEPLLALREITGREDVLDFCEWLYQDYSSHEPEFPGGDCRLPALFDPARPFVGHGPHTCEQLRIPLVLFHHTGKEIYWHAFRAGIEKLDRVRNLSGSCKSDELIGSYPAGLPAGQRTFAELMETLPLPSAGYEYCATVELSNTYLYALSLTGDLEYADRQEWLAFNAAQAAWRADGKAIQYLCADNLFAATRQIGERWDYSPTHADAAVCCAPNSGKLIPNYLLNSWMRDSRDDALVALLYGPSELRLETGNGPVMITEDTCYPFENTVRFRISLVEPMQLGLKFRIPRWASHYALFINGEKCPVDEEKHAQNRLMVVDQTWKNGDELLFHMDWKPQVHLAVDHSAAISYGPLLYCLRIPEHAEHYHSYPLEGFCDTDYLPVGGSRWDYTLQLEKDGAPGKFVLPVSRPVQKGDYEWERPPLTLHATMLNQAAQPEIVQLVPLGSTILRRTTFPWVHYPDRE